MTAELFVIAILLPLVLGAVLGWLGGLLGIGGGILAIPVLVMGFGLPQQLAQGTALVMIVPNVLLGFWRYQQRNRQPLRGIAVIAIVALMSTWPAARLAVLIDPRLLMIGFATFLFGLSVYFLWGAKKPVPAIDAPGRVSDRWLPGVGLLGGTLSGLFSVGAAIVTTPLLVNLFGRTQSVAQGISLAVVIPGAFLSLSVYSHAGMVNWTTGLALAAGGMSTVSSGVSWAHRLPEKVLRRSFAVMLLLTAVTMIAKGGFA